MLHSISGRRPAETLGAFRIPAYLVWGLRVKTCVWLGVSLVLARPPAPNTHFLPISCRLLG